MAGKTILVVDGNDTSRIYLSTTLRKKGFTTFEASSGREALIFAWRDHPDLVLFDPVISDLQVEEFIQKLRREARTNNTPLIALSSNADVALKQRCVQAGATESMVKLVPSLHAH